MQRPSGGRKGTLHKVTRLEKQQVRGVPDEPGEGRSYLGEHWEIRVLMRGLEVI